MVIWSAIVKTSAAFLGFDTSASNNNSGQKLYFKVANNATMSEQ